MRDLSWSEFALCKFQGRIFEKSVDTLKCSSPYFIENYMQSDIARNMDISTSFDSLMSEGRILSGMKDLKRGRRKYTSEEMYAIGHMYRYISYIYGIESKELYKLLPCSLLRRYAITWSFQGPEKVLLEIREYHHISISDSID